MRACVRACTRMGVRAALTRGRGRAELDGDSSRGGEDSGLGAREGREGSEARLEASLARDGQAALRGATSAGSALRRVLAAARLLQADRAGALMGKLAAAARELARAGGPATLADALLRQSGWAATAGPAPDSLLASALSQPAVGLHPPPHCCPYPCSYCTLKGGGLGWRGGRRRGRDRPRRGLAARRGALRLAHCAARARAPRARLVGGRWLQGPRRGFVSGG